MGKWGWLKHSSRSSLLEGVEIVRSVPPTAGGEGDVQPLNREWASERRIVGIFVDDVPDS